MVIPDKELSSPGLGRKATYRRFNPGVDSIPQPDELTLSSLRDRLIAQTLVNEAQSSTSASGDRFSPTPFQIQDFLKQTSETARKPKKGKRSR